MAKETQKMSRTLPRSIVVQIKKAVAKWEPGEARDLVKMLIDSHEELRWESEQYKRYYHASQGKKKK